MTKTKIFEINSISHVTERYSDRKWFQFRKSSLYENISTDLLKFFGLVLTGIFLRREGALFIYNYLFFDFN